jgi:hypothetical protein
MQESVPEVSTQTDKRSTNGRNINIHTRHDEQVDPDAMFDTFLTQVLIENVPCLQKDDFPFSASSIWITIPKS